MDSWLDFAMGPLFAVTFLFMLLGLARHVVLQVHLLVTKGRMLRRVRWRTVLMDTLSWALPYDHLVRGTLLLTFASILFHVGVVVVPLFLGDHVALWETHLGIQLPAVGEGLADALTLTTIACLLVLLSYRVLIPRSRELSRPSDYALPVMVLLPFVTGFMAAHPPYNPLPWNAMMLVHVLSAEALFLSVPFSKLSHMVLFPFDRLSQVHWQLRAGAGDRIAAALFGEEARV
jgi:nitrate reductase gamma subunit